jgi:hypothetical protein
MITIETHKLMSLQDIFPALIDIADDAAERDPEEALIELKMYSQRGADCVLMKDSGEPIGYIIYGPAEKFIDFTEELTLLIRMKKEGGEKPYSACHVHLRKKYLKGGYTARMAVEYCRNIVAEGGTHLLLWGYATDELANYAIAKPGVRLFEGMTDGNGRPVGVRDLSVFLKAVEGQE